jgi:hypothetical protein
MRRVYQRSVPLVVVATILTMGGARPSTAQTSAAFDKLQPLAFLAGSCWKGTFAGRPVTDEHCFAWVYGGRFLRDHHVVRGDSLPYEGETTYAWDASQKSIVYWYIALPGFYSHGNVAPTDGALLFHDNLVTSTPRQLRTTWRRSSAEAYTVLVEEVTAGKSHELWSMVMRRSKPAPPALP